jgi:hypothetical protein
VSKRRLISATAILAGLMAASPAAQKPSINEVLKRSAWYVADFRKQLSGIVAEETYRQEIVSTARIGGGAGPVRTLRSDYLLVMPSDADRHVELRDVFEVDGKAVRGRQARLENMVMDPAAAARLGDIISESARYNIGSVRRTINTPLMALIFLDANNQGRFRFRHVEKQTPVFPETRDTAINDAPVFRVATEIWTVEYQEQRKPTIVTAPNGDSRPAHGRFWIDPTTGSVLISELIVDGGGVIATVTVSYQSEPLMGFLVPVEMRESYIRNSERISGRAEYSKFRQIQK